MEDKSLKEQLEEKERSLVALLAQHDLAGDVLRKKQRLDARKMREKAKRQGNTPPPFGSSTRDVSSPKKSPVKPVMYQDELSERLKYEELLKQCNLDHERALEENQKQINVLKERLIQQKEDINMILEREKSIKYYGRLLTAGVDTALLNVEKPLSEDDKRYIRKVSSTLSYLLNDGDITLSIKKEVNEAQVTSNISLSLDIEEEKSQQALKASIKNRRGSVNIVPFESAMLYGQPQEHSDVGNAKEEQMMTRSVSKSRRGTLNAVPFNMMSKPESNRSPSNLLSIDEICIDEKDDDQEEVDHDEEESVDVDFVANTMTAVICHCKESIPFRILNDKFEQKCSALFETVYKRSLMSYNESTKLIEATAPMESNPMNQWLGKSSFLIFMFSTGNIDSRLTMQACAYCFDKAANENSSRSRYKLNMRIYYEDFLSALSSAAQFKYKEDQKVKSNKRSCQRSKLEKIVDHCCEAVCIKKEMVYYDLADIFRYCKSPDFFTTFANSQDVLLKAYKRCVNYACINNGFVGNQKRQWPSKTAANGNLAMAAQTTIESSGQGFYYFCKSYNIFPTLTQESACRRVAQHVRKICDDSTTSFFACLIYLALSLASNTDLIPSQSDAAATMINAIDPQLSARMTSIIERVVTHIEGENLKLDRK